MTIGQRTGTNGLGTGLPALLFLVLGLTLFCHPAEALDADPSDPGLFMGNPDRPSGFPDSLGPGQGPVRKSSTKADVHAGVEGFSPPRRCLSCHDGQQNNLHYARTELVCKDCHITRPISGIRNPAASVFEDHRAEKACARCHEGAPAAMGSFVIHERLPWSAETRIDFPALYWATLAMLALSGGVFAVFLPLTLLWAVREIGSIRFKRNGEASPHKSDAPALRRFSASARWFHTVLVVCFMALSVTGIAWMYIETPFGQGLARIFGGYEIAILAHRIFGLVLMVAFASHLAYLLGKARRMPPGSLSGPDSLVWTWGDFRTFFHHIGWLLGRRAQPVFDRWTWWQKFDYWAVWWGLIIVGSTGLILFDPVLTAKVFPGWTMNVARWVHKIEALLAMGHIFVVHFFIESYRPKAFPLNTHVFHGAADLDHITQEHPAWVERLQSQGKLNDHLTTQPPKLVQFAYFGFGVSMVALGLFLMAAMIAFAADLSV